MGERFEHEPAQMRARMGNDQAHLVESFDAVIDDVQIKGARSVDIPQKRSSPLDLKFLKIAQEMERRQQNRVDLDLRDGIEKGRRSGRTIDRRRFDPRRFPDLAMFGQLMQEENSRVQFGEAVADV